MWCFISPLNRLVILGFCAVTISLSNSSHAVETSDGGKAWKNKKTKTLRAAKTSDTRNKYGGFAGEKVASPGYFRLIEKHNKWWLVDPQGCLFLSVGLNSVGPERIGAKDETAWTKKTKEMITGAGFNTIGRWSAAELFDKHNHNIPWCSTHMFMKAYSKARPKNRGQRGYPNETIPVFDPEWPAFCKMYAEANLKNTIDDPYLLGHFSDNELPFRPYALTQYLSLPESDAGHQAAVAWMKKNNISKAKANTPKVHTEFLEHVSKHYFETVSKAIKAVDPNHLYIGSRIHGKAINEGVLTGAAVCDIISINYYHRWVPDKKQTQDWNKWSKRPFLIGEFYAMKVQSKQTKGIGAGFRVLNHKDAGEFYHTFTQDLLFDIPNCVGWHWFKYADDSDQYQKGIISQKGEFHTELLDAMKVLNTQVYSLRGLR